MTPTPETLLKTINDDFAVCPFCKGWDFVNGKRKHSLDCVGAQSANLWAASEEARQRAEKLLRDFPCPLGSVVNVNALLEWNAKRAAALAPDAPKEPDRELEDVPGQPGNFRWKEAP